MPIEEHDFDLHVRKYGASIHQEGDLYIPKGDSIGTVCLLHGGFWKMPYNRSQFTEIAKQLAKLGFVVWNIEYRRIGDNKVSYNEILNDTLNAINEIVRLKDKYTTIRLNPLFIVGHSAGGQLALWAGKKSNGITKNSLIVSPTAIIGLAPVVDLRKSYYDNNRKEFIYDYLGSAPNENDRLYKLASPIEMLPIGIKQWIIHGIDDEAIPISEIDEYVNKAKNFGDEITYIKVKNGTHMGFIDPNSVSAITFFDMLIDSNIIN
jgi:acetyl esterase/lipase